jgi:hypothetical protein
LKPGQRPYRQAAWFYAEHRYRPGEAFFASSRRISAGPTLIESWI